MLVSYPRLCPVAGLRRLVAQLQSVPRLLGALGDVLADARDDPLLSLECSLAHYSDHLVMPWRSLAFLGVFSGVLVLGSSARAHIILRGLRLLPFLIFSASELAVLATGFALALAMPRAFSTF